MKIVVVGGGAGGASCAARLGRLCTTEQVLILEKTDEISIATCGLPYYSVGIIKNRDAMMVSDVETFKKKLGVEVKLNTEVTEIRREEKEVVTKDGQIFGYDKLVLSMGAKPFVPPIDGVNLKHVFTIRHLKDADNIKAFLNSNQVNKIAVIGGGAIGVEMAENMRYLGKEVTLIEQGSQLLSYIDRDMISLIHNEMIDNEIKLVFEDGVSKIMPSTVVLNSGKEVEADMVILAIGIRAQTDIAKNAGLEMGMNNTIKVNELLQTSDEDIYACGDAIEVVDFVSKEKTQIALAGPANRQGRIIADNIKCGKKRAYEFTQGSAIVKVFGLTVGNTGNNEKQLNKRGVKYNKIHLWAKSHAGYYPDSEPMLMKLLFADDGTVFGAQIVGSGGVDKRIDVIATIMKLSGKLEDLIEAELCYAPPYSGAKDPVNLVGMSASNVLMGYLKPAYDVDGAFLIDVRSPASFRLHTIDGAVNIPIYEFEQRLSELPKDKKIVLFCTNGFNSYLASLTAIHNGFDNVYSLSGGMNFYDAILKDKINMQ